MRKHWEALLRDWLDAGLIDAGAADRIRSFQEAKTAPGRSRWPVFLAWGFGGLMLGAGVLLFVAAHWESLSPAGHFALVLGTVALFHLVAAGLSSRLPLLAAILHVVGTVSFGAGIFLTAQIFHLEEHWPGAFMLWAAGALAAWILLRDWAHAALVAILTPVWLAGEWIVATGIERKVTGPNGLILGEGLLLLAITYFAACLPDRSAVWRKALMWMGGLMILPCILFLVETQGRSATGAIELSASVTTLGWACAFGLPLLIATLLRGPRARDVGLWALWVVLFGSVVSMRTVADEPTLRYVLRSMGPYLLCALGSIGMVAWGLAEQRRERINMGVAGFALTVLVFYFSSVMDRLGRATSLIALGLLFLVGGWLLERTRRRLVAHVQRRNHEAGA